MDQQTLIQFLKKYKDRGDAINKFFIYLKRNDFRFQDTFLKGKKFTSYDKYAGCMKHISGEDYFGYLCSKSISEIAKDLLNFIAVADKK